MDLPATRRALHPMTRCILDASMSPADEDVGKCVRQVDVDSHPPEQQVGRGCRGLGASHPDSRRGVIHRKSSGAGQELRSTRNGSRWDPVRSSEEAVAARTCLVERHQAGAPSPATPRTRHALATARGAATPARAAAPAITAAAKVSSSSGTTNAPQSGGEDRARAELGGRYDRRALRHGLEQHQPLGFRCARRRRTHRRPHNSPEVRCCDRGSR